ncbi:hypothetical protein D3C85_1755130 [compost metagenome]
MPRPGIIGHPINDHFPFSAVNKIKPVEGRRLVRAVPAGILRAELGISYGNIQILQQPSRRIEVIHSATPLKRDSLYYTAFI